MKKGIGKWDKLLVTPLVIARLIRARSGRKLSGSGAGVMAKCGPICIGKRIASAILASGMWLSAELTK